MVEKDVAKKMSTKGHKKEKIGLLDAYFFNKDISLDIIQKFLKVLTLIVQQIGDKIWPNRSFCDKSSKFSENVGFNPLIEIGYGPIM